MIAPLAAGRLLAALAALARPLFGVVLGESGDTGGEPPAAARDDPDPPAARAARAAMVAGLARREPRLAERTLAALRAVPRHLFIPGAPLERAYEDHAQPIGHGQTISQPTVVALTTNALRLAGTERVLEIGTGSGYQAAILAALAAHVYSIEVVAELTRDARARLAALGCRNVTLRHGDGYLGWPEEAPFDCIVLTAAPPRLPAALVAQLADGGRLVGPVGEGDDQHLYRWTRHDDGLTREHLCAVRFVPMVRAEPT